MDGYGWKARGDFEAADRYRKPFVPTFRQALTILPMLIRYLIYYLMEWWHNRARFIDFIFPMRHSPYHGVPCGGIGCGGIGRDFRGGFCKFSLRPGMVEQNVKQIKANQFILTLRRKGVTVYQRVLSAVPYPNRKTLKSWQFDFPATDIHYRGLYPRSWTKYEIKEFGLSLVCRQISPVIPHNYKDSSLPTCIFAWEIENSSDQDFEMTLTMTFRNGTGDKRWDREGICRSQSSRSDNIEGIVLHHSVSGMPCAYVLATNSLEKTECMSVTKRYFDPTSDGSLFWNDLFRNGKFHFSFQNTCAEMHEMGVAVACQHFLPADNRAKISVEFCLVWHMPVVHFGGKRRQYKRRYTRYFGTEMNASKEIAKYALRSFCSWESGIDKWQQPILDDESLPEWYKSALFNELYYLTDGGTVWMEFDPLWTEDEPQMSRNSASHFAQYGRFGYLESWEYYMLNTYDVHFYASFALLSNWPQLEISIQMDFTDQVLHTDKRKVKSLSENDTTFVKNYGRLLHDFGHPGDDPWLLPNAYVLHDSGEWKDLNLKFVLSAYRDHVTVMKEGDVSFLEDSYPAIELIIKEGLLFWDTDGDGLIENSGHADQTYDMWIMHGSSAYCGSLWLAALRSAQKIAQLLGKGEDAVFYARTLARAATAFQSKLWTGSFYRFDEFSGSAGTVMADQLCGIWYLGTFTGISGLVPDGQVEKALGTIYANNVCKFGRGQLGAVNGMLPNGQIDTCCIQADEMWTGTSYALSSFFLLMNKREEGMAIAKGVYESVWKKSGLQYQTPEAMYEQGFYRAIGYMRPLAIWSIQWVLSQQRSNNRRN